MVGGHFPRNLNQSDLFLSSCAFKLFLHLLIISVDRISKENCIQLILHSFDYTCIQLELYSFDFVIGSKAVDCLMDSKWASGKGGAEILFTDRVSVELYLDR